MSHSHNSQRTDHDFSSSFAPKSRFAENKFSNVDVFRKTNKHVAQTSFNCVGCVNSMKCYVNISRCGTCCCHSANYFGNKCHANNWFGYYDDYFYSLHAKSKRSKPKKKAPKKIKVVKQGVTPNPKGPNYK